jgi:transcriptional regulator with XRE-family HTH domain
MPRLSLSNLGAMVKKRRGASKLRETAKEIGISAPTLLRVESGRLPDLDTFGKICRWLQIDPGDFRPTQQSGCRSPNQRSRLTGAKTSEPEH